MKRVAAILGLISGIMLALGRSPEPFMASGYVLLVLIGFGKIIFGIKKPFGPSFWAATFILLITPFFICQLILTIGWPYIIIALAISALIYIYFNSDGQKKSTISGGERTPLDQSHFNDFSWDDLEVN